MKRLEFSSPTLRALLATGLGVLPLKELFTNWGWVLDVWMAIAIVLVPAAILRTSRPAAVWHTWLGVLLLAPWLTARFASDHAIASFIPTGATWDDVTTLLDQVRDVSQHGVAPVHADAAMTFVLALVAGLLAAFIDLVAVVARRGALAGVPLLVIYTISGAVPRHPVSWLLFVGAASGFLLLLSVDADDRVHRWGRLIPRDGALRFRATLAVSAPRIAAAAIAVAVLLPLFAPSTGSNPLSNAFHGKKTTTGTGGFGAGGGISLEPFAALKGQLKRDAPQDLFTVTISGQAGVTPVDPFYLRANVLSTYTSRGWIPARHDVLEDVDSPVLDTTPQLDRDPNSDVETFSAQIHVHNLADNPPVFALPSTITDLNRASWSAVDQILLSDQHTSKGDTYGELVHQTNWAPGVLENATSDGSQFVNSRWLDVPNTMPSRVRDLVYQLTRGIATPYAKALALNDYFTNPRNGFTYSLDATQGDSGNDLADFLAIKAGYCQQYAGALGIMLRMAGVPARVVLGYTHPRPNAAGTFTVTTDNAHAWVEAYFDGEGWVPFDPTPLAGQAEAGGATAQLPWAPHPSASAQSNTAVSSSAPPTSATRSERQTEPGTSTGSHRSTSHGTPAWLPFALAISGIFVVLLVLPGAVRELRRRRRLAAAGRGDADALWDELSATATDLGYVWSPARSPRQVYTWLEPQLRTPSSNSALHTMAVAVERQRYAPTVTTAGSLVAELKDVESQLRHRRNRKTRIRSRLLPASLGWWLPGNIRRH
ncbi:MAG TPA: DUF3488 and transglutaminase-like domain-containing protein [Jatrophihabitantaceae bacterium]|nr:DUF3488 and transglutaminase-like domain-containing protein [Jatrophihabitantaceae bacterium]